MVATGQVRALCLALPEAFELEAWEHPTFRVGNGRGKIFCTAATDGSTVAVKADLVEREALVAQGDPFFTPAYVGSKGWVGIRTDHPKDRLGGDRRADRHQLLPDRAQTPRSSGAQRPPSAAVVTKMSINIHGRERPPRRMK